MAAVGQVTNTNFEQLKKVEEVTSTNLEQLNLKVAKMEQITSTKLEQLNLEVAKLRQVTSTTSYLEFHSQLVEKGLSKTDPSMVKKIVQSSVPLLPITTLDVGAEAAVVQPFWSAKIKELNEHLAGVNSAVVFYDSHKTRILEKSGKSPDIVVLKRGGGNTCINIVIIGELKGIEQMNNAALGQVEKYLQELLQSQCFRDKAYGFLTDNVSLKVVFAERSTNGGIRYTWCCNERWDGGEANRILSSLVSSSLEKLCYSKPVVKVNNQEIVLKYTLGKGLSGIVYTGELNGMPVVVKVPNSKEKLEKERKVLAALEQGGVKNIPQFCSVNGVDDRGKALLLTPVAQRFAGKLEAGIQMASCHVRQIVKALYGAHRLGYVHRDVRYCNIFAVSEEEALLNDWGSAWSKGDCTSTYEGVKIEASDHILVNLINNTEFVPLPADDLHALARTVYCYLYTPPLLVTNDQLQKFWKGLSNKWTAIFSMADEINCEDFSTYEKFAESLSDFLPK